MTQNIENSFQEAIEIINENQDSVKKLNAQDQLELYALFKLATVGPCNDTLTKPGWFDFRGQAKWDAWHKKSQILQDQTQAMQQYIKLVNKLFDSQTNQSISTSEPSKQEHTKNKSKNEFTVSVSVLENCEEVISDDQKDIFDWCSEGNIEQFKIKLKLFKHKGEKSINEIVNQDGMSLLHWACDREHTDITKFLIEDEKIDVNLIDSEGQTALHIASLIGNLSIAKELVSHGIDINIENEDGCTAWQVFLEYHGQENDFYEWEKLMKT